jgi:hypothetical protein
VIPTLERRIEGRDMVLIAANRGSIKPFERKEKAREKAKFYKRTGVFDSVRVWKVKGGYALYTPKKRRRRRK